MSTTRQIVLSILLLVVAGGGWWAYEHGWFTASRDSAPAVNTAARQGGQPGGGQQNGGRGGFGGAPPPVVAAPVTIDHTGIDVTTVGTVAATQAATIFPQVSGVVTEVAFKPGTAVSAGDILVKLDDADQQVAVDRAEVALEAAEAAAARTAQLAKSSNATAVALQDARTAVRKAEIDLRAAKLDLAKRTINAPFSGTVGLTDLNVGDLVSSAKEVATLDDMSTVRVAFQVPERASGLVKVGDPINATSDALAGQSFTGAVTAVDSRVDATTRTLSVEASVPNGDGALKPGMALTVNLAFSGEAHPSVPSLAIQWDRQGSYVWKVDGEVVRRTAVQIITRRSGVVTVAGNLGEGDMVVTDGVLRLREGIAVTLEEVSTPPAEVGEDAPTPDAAAGMAPARSKS